MRWLILVLVFYRTAFAATETLTVNDVIQKILAKSPDRGLIDQTYHGSESLIYAAKSPFSTDFNMNYGYELSRLQALSGITNPEDRNLTMGTGLSKKLPTGTTMGVQYSRTVQRSVLSNFTSALRPPNQTQDLVSLNFRQRLLNNMFGFQDRIKIEVANISRTKSHIDRDESLERLVMDSIRAYWDCYAAKESLRENLVAREKYKTLVEYIQRKHKQGLTDRGELSRTEAELSNQERAVKTASLGYINSIERLYLLMNQPIPEEVELSVPDLLPPAPAETQPVEVGSLRKIKSQALAVQAAEQERGAAMKADLPSLDFVGKLAANAVEKTGDRSLPEMINGRHPNYFVGLEFTYAFDSDLIRSERVAKQVQYQTSLIQMEKLKAETLAAVDHTARNARAKYLVAKSAVETSESWEKVIAEQERNFRFGRIASFELTQDYAIYLRSIAARSLAIADYNVSLQEYLEARDQLIKE